MNKKILLSSFVIVTTLGISLSSSLLLGETDASPKFQKHPDAHNKDLAIQYAFPIEHVDKNGDLVFVTLSGITQGTEVSDPIPDIVRAINDFGGLAASQNVIEYTDAEGNVFMRIPEELDSQFSAKEFSRRDEKSISHDTLSIMIKKHNEKVNEYKAAEGMKTLELYDDKEWPEAKDGESEDDDISN